MKILVTGATGNVGRNVVVQLVEAGAQVRAMSRNPGVFPAGVEAAKGDLNRPETVPFDGIDRMFLFPQADGVAEVVKRAGEAGVRRIVALSSSAQDDGFHVNEMAAEAAVTASGLEWTIVRPGEFMANTLEWVTEIKDKGSVSIPYVDVPSLMIHEADIAAVIVTALLEDGHDKAKYELTGPEPITPREQVATVAAAIGREISLNALTPEQARELWLSQGWPAEIADWMLMDPSEWVGADPQITSTVQDVTGRPGRTYAQWAQDHAADFR